MIKVSCIGCGKNFTTYPSLIEIGRGKFCSNKCKYWAARDRWTKENNPRWGGGGVEKRCSVCSKHFSVERYRTATAKFCSPRCSQVYQWGRPDYRKNQVEKHIGQPPSAKQRLIARSRRGPLSPNWRGGVTPLHSRIRKQIESVNWRKAVFERDGFTCVFCGKRGGRLNADHIKPFAMFPELRFDLDNGRTLCVDCHRKTETWGWNKKKMQRTSFYKTNAQEGKE
jgi:5-methylcytosine-specific restriction endonuclease McrA